VRIECEAYVFVAVNISAGVLMNTGFFKAFS